LVKEEKEGAESNHYESFSKTSADCKVDGDNNIFLDIEYCDDHMVFDYTDFDSFDSFEGRLDRVIDYDLDPKYRTVCSRYTTEYDYISECPVASQSSEIKYTFNKCFWSVGLNYEPNFSLSTGIFVDPSSTGGFGDDIINKETQAWIRKMHNKIGHSPKLIKILSDGGFNKQCLDYAEKVRNECDQCKKWNNLSRRYSSAGLSQYASYPLEKIQVDILWISVHGEKYKKRVISLLDLFSRYSVLYYVGDDNLSSDFAVTKGLHYFMSYCDYAPQEVYFDPGPEGKNTAFLEACSFYNIICHLGARKNAARQGKVERLNGEIKKIISKLIDQPQFVCLGPQDVLHVVMSAMNDIPVLNSSYSPRFLLRGQDSFRKPVGELVYPDDINYEPKLTEWNLEREKARQLAIAEVSKENSLTVLKRAFKHNIVSQPKDGFQLGDLVVLRRNGVWSDIGTIVGLVSPSNCAVKSNNSNRVINQNINDLRLVSGREIAGMNIDEETLKLNRHRYGLHKGTNKKLPKATERNGVSMIDNDESDLLDSRPKPIPHKNVPRNERIPNSIFENQRNTLDSADSDSEDDDWNASRGLYQSSNHFKSNKSILEQAVEQSGKNLDDVVLDETQTLYGPNIFLDKKANKRVQKSNRLLYAGINNNIFAFNSVAPDNVDVLSGTHVFDEQDEISDEDLVPINLFHTEKHEYVQLKNLTAMLRTEFSKNNSKNMITPQANGDIYNEVCKCLALPESQRRNIRGQGMRVYTNRSTWPKQFKNSSMYIFGPNKNLCEVMDEELNPKSKDFIVQIMWLESEQIAPDDKTSVENLFPISQRTKGAIELSRAFIVKNGLERVFESAIKDELDSIITKFGAFDLSSDEIELENEEDNNIVDSRFVLTLKFNSSGELIKPKARLCARGFKDQRDFSATRIRTDTASDISLFCFLQYSVQHQYESLTVDLKNAFLQSSEEFFTDRVILILPDEAAKILGRSRVRLIKPIYGLKDAPICWQKSLFKTFRKIGLVQSKIDPACWIYIEDRELRKRYIQTADAETVSEEVETSMVSAEASAAVLTHVDDLFISGKDKILKYIRDAILENFVGAETSTNRFCGRDLCRVVDEETGYFSWHISQKEYIQALCLIKPEDIAEYQRVSKLPYYKYCKNIGNPYKAAAGRILWLTKTRPDISYLAHIVSSVADSPFCDETTNIINDAIIQIKNRPMVVIKLRYIKNPRVAVLSDSAIGVWSKDGRRNNHVGVLIVLLGEDGVCSPLAWSSKKMKRVCSSSTGGEILGVRYGISLGLYVLSVLKSYNIPSYNKIFLYCDSRNVVVRSSGILKAPEERNLRADFVILAQLIENNQVSIEHLCGLLNLSDALTKSTTKVMSLLLKFLDNGILVLTQER